MNMVIEVFECKGFHDGRFSFRIKKDKKVIAVAVESWAFEEDVEKSLIKTLIRTKDAELIFKEYYDK